MEERQDDEWTVLNGVARDRLFAGARLAKADAGRRFLSRLAADRSVSDDIRADALFCLPAGTDVELLEPAVESFLLHEQNAQIRWLGVERCVREGLFRLTKLVEALRGDHARIGWIDSFVLSGLVEQALALLEAERRDPSFGKDVI